jgi:hypothetical protein
VTTIAPPALTRADEIPISVTDIRFAEHVSSLRFVMQNDSEETFIGWRFRLSARYPDGFTARQAEVWDCDAQPTEEMRTRCILLPNGRQEAETRWPLHLRSGQAPESATVEIEWAASPQGVWRGGRAWTSDLPDLRAGREDAWREILAILEECRKDGGGAAALDAARRRLHTSRPHPLKRLVLMDLRVAAGRVAQGRSSAASECEALIRDIRRANRL